MKTPPFLVLAALLFWGWQSHLLWAAAVAGGLLELSRFVRFRWDLEDVDFNRIWSFCVVLTLALAGYFLTQSSESTGFARVVSGGHYVPNSQGPNLITMLRWLPLVFFPFFIAQAYNERPSVPLTAVSLVLRLRRRRGEQSLAGHYLDISYAYFIVCLFSAGVHANQGTYYQMYNYFLGLCFLILWALWNLRSGRFGVGTWVGGLVAVIILGFAGQFGINQLEQIIQNFDARMLARFLRSRNDPSQSITSMGQIGDLKMSPRIVIRLKPYPLGQAPDYLREASYRTYNAAKLTWFAGVPNRDFTPMQPESDARTWILLSNKTSRLVVNISCYLNGRSPPPDQDPQDLLPVPSGVCRLENMPVVNQVYALQTNRIGAIMAIGPGLMNFDARYGPGPTFDSPPDSDGERLDYVVPINEAPALRQILADMNIPPEAPDAEKRALIAGYFTRHFTYSTWQAAARDSATNASPLTRFLLTTHGGHCEFFATATVLLLREMGIPARYAVGYYVHEPSGAGYVVRDRDAHAWCLAWDSQTKMWRDFDTTPATWTAIERQNASMADFLSDAWSWIVYEFERFRWGQANLRQYILWTLTPVLAVLLYYIVFRRRAKQRKIVVKPPPEMPVVWPGHDSVFYQLEKSLALRGVERQPQESLSDWLERALEESALASLRAPLRQLLQFHYRYRFDPLGLDDNEKKSFVQNAHNALEALGRMEPVA